MGDDERANPFERSRADKLQQAADCFEKSELNRQKGRFGAARKWKDAGEAWQEEAGEPE